MRPNKIPDYYQVEFADLHQLLSIQSDLLHVNGDREHRVWATAKTQNSKRNTYECDKRLQMNQSKQ